MFSRIDLGFLFVKDAISVRSSFSYNSSASLSNMVIMRDGYPQIVIEQTILIYKYVLHLKILFIKFFLQMQFIFPFLTYF
jgi:hypothetical protein